MTAVLERAAKGLLEQNMYGGQVEEKADLLAVRPLNREYTIETCGANEFSVYVMTNQWLIKQSPYMAVLVQVISK